MVNRPRRTTCRITHCEAKPFPDSPYCLDHRETLLHHNTPRRYLNVRAISKGTRNHFAHIPILTPEERDRYAF
jgi:hypothetical protein